MLAAVVHTVRSFGIDEADFRAFLSSMAMDLTVTSYASYDHLLRYMDGSAGGDRHHDAAGAGVRRPGPGPRARPPARAWPSSSPTSSGTWARICAAARIYLPGADLDRFGVAAADLARPEPTAAVRDLLAFECARARAHYRAALPGVELLAPSSQPCIRAALELYGGILDELERRDYQVLRGRVRLSRRRRAAIFARHLTAAARAARRERQVDVRLPGS